MRRINLLLLIILFIGCFLRFYRLGEVPLGFHKDEAFLGYNSYSILKTGKDMNGNFLPLHLQSFLYSPAGYSYFTIPFITLFGLSVSSVRFASAFFGTATIFVTFLLVKKIFEKNTYSEIVALLSAFLIAISPWNINLSRTATESVLVVFFIALGTYLFLLFGQNKKFYLLLTAFVCFFITIFIYQAPRSFLPFYVPSLFLYLKGFKGIKSLKHAIYLYLLTIILPLFLILGSKDLSLRIRTVSIFANPGPQISMTHFLAEDNVLGFPLLVSRLFYNKYTIYSRDFFKNYFDHFSYDFLFTDAGYPVRYRVPLSGLLYIFEIPFLIFGMYQLLKSDKKTATFLSLWIILAPLGSALTYDDVPNLQRTLILFPALSIVSAYGIFSIFALLKKKKMYFIPSLLVICAIGMYSFLYYLHQYYYHVSSYQPWNRNEGYKELVSKVDTLKTGYKRIIVTDRESAPTIFFLFYNKYDPSKFQKDTYHTTMKDFDRINFGEYEFSQEECPLNTNPKTQAFVPNKFTLYVNSGLCAVADKTRELAQIKRSDGSIAFRIVDLK